MRFFLAIITLLALSALAANNFEPYNTQIFFEDSLRIDSTETKFSEAFWQDNGLWKCFLIEARDDTNYLAGGWSVCTSAVSIELYQGFPVTNEYGVNARTYATGYSKYIAALPSKAHPDSTAMHPLSFVMFDSLVISSMDTAAVYSRNAVIDTNLTGQTMGYHYGDSLKTLQSTGFGAFVYTCLPPDASPAGVFKFTGTSKNEKRGAGSFWRIRGYQIKAMVTK